MNPKHPIYVISKGRADTSLTSRALTRMAVPHRVVIEPQEFEVYAAALGPEILLTLPFSNLGLGSIPARNWVWEHSIAEGHSWHWILDDNIDGFVRFHHNKKTPLTTGAAFAVTERFVERYENVVQAGFQYEFFEPSRRKIPPLIWNTRIYSCILMRNDIRYRWRGRYNEDTDLSIRILKDGLCTVLLRPFQACKARTMTMKGGNTDILYAGDGRIKMAQELLINHPDCVRIVERWGRYQHRVDYSAFRKNKARLRADAAGIEPAEGEL
jgi:hypothetical protein